MKRIISGLSLLGLAWCFPGCATRPHVEPFLNDDMCVWFYNPYSNDNEEVLLPKLGERLKQAGFPSSTRVLIYTDLKLTPFCVSENNMALFCVCGHLWIDAGTG